MSRTSGYFVAGQHIDGEAGLLQLKEYDEENLFQGIHTMKVECEGNRYNLYYDNELVFEGKNLRSDNPNRVAGIYLITSEGDFEVDLFSFEAINQVGGE